MNSTTIQKTCIMSSFYSESQTFDSSMFNSSWSTINSNPETANTSNWSILTSPPKQLKREFIENHEVPLDKLFSELPFYIWDQGIWPKLDLETLLETYKALVEQQETGNLKNCSDLHQSRLQRQHIPNSIKNSSIQEITKALQKQALELKISKKLQQKVNNNHTPPKRRKLIKPVQKITKYEESVNQIQQIIVEKILSLLNFNHHNYPILKNTLKTFLLEAPKRLSLIYLANLKVIIPDCWKNPIADLRRYVAEMIDFRDLYTIACFTLKVLYSFSTEEVRVRISDPTLGLMITMPDSIQIVEKMIWP